PPAPYTTLFRSRVGPGLPRAEALAHAVVVVLAVEEDPRRALHRHLLQPVDLLLAGRVVESRPHVGVELLELRRLPADLDVTVGVLGGRRHPAHLPHPVEQATEAAQAKGCERAGALPLRADGPLDRLDLDDESDAPEVVAHSLRDLDVLEVASDRRIESHLDRLARGVAQHALSVGRVPDLGEERQSALG